MVNLRHDVVDACLLARHRRVHDDVGQGRTLSAMTDLALRERAALDVMVLLPEWWAVGPTSYDPGTGRWSFTARGPHPGRGKMPETIIGTGEDELAAMTDLAIRLDERRRSDQLAAIDRRGRAAFLDGAEERPMTVEGRPLTAYELKRVT